jgi:hypothetical protein
MLIENRPKKLDRSRRSFLKAVGAGAVALPFFRLLASSVSDAQTAMSPLRLLVIFNPLGMPFDYWRPQMTSSGYTLDFPQSVLAPLSKYQDKMIILDGIDIVPEIKYGDFGHLATGSLLTGDVYKDLGGVNPTVQSLDQFLAFQSTVGGQTAYRSLELGVGGNKTTSHVMSWGPNGAILPRINNPYGTFKTLFANYKPADAGAGGPSQADLNAIAQKKSVLDYVQADVKRLQSRLGTLEKQKLDLHLTAVSDIERRLTGGAGAGGMMMAAGCAPPTTFTDEATWQGMWQQDPTTIVNFPADPPYGNFMFDHIQELTDLQIAMIAQAFACDLTRVITLQFFEDGCDGGAPWAQPMVPSSDPFYDPHVCTHADTSDPRRAPMMAVYQTWYAQQVANLMDQLAAIPEGNGTVLDHTLIFWSNENGEAHDLACVPMILAGGCNGVFTMGRYLKYNYPDNTRNDAAPYQPHNALLVSIANAFPGVNINSYGNTSAYNWGTGGLPQL